MPVFEKTTFSPSAHTRNAPPLPDSLMQSNQPCRPPTTSCSPHDPLSRYPTAPLSLHPMTPYPTTPRLPCLSTPWLPCLSTPRLPCLSTPWLPCLSTPWLPCLSTPRLPCLSTPWLPCAKGAGCRRQTEGLSLRLPALHHVLLAHAPLCKARKTHKPAPLVQRGEVKGGLSPRLPLPVKIAPLSPPPLRAASPYHKGRHENGA